MLGVGEKFPSYSLTAVVSMEKGKEFATITDESFPGKWRVYFFWPKDFTFVCPTEIAGFAKFDRDFKERDAQLLGASIDSEFVHLGWRREHEDLRNLPFPMLSDFKRELAGELGILDPVVGAPQRAAYIVDPDGIIRFVYVTDLSVGREPKEVLRVLDALQTDELCPCGWQKGDAVLQA
jgi:lipoyl-dependent peroxiredoxin subunit C